MYTLFLMLSQIVMSLASTQTIFSHIPSPKENPVFCNQKNHAQNQFTICDPNNFLDPYVYNYHNNYVNEIAMETENTLCYNSYLPYLNEEYFYDLNDKIPRGIQVNSLILYKIDPVYLPDPKDIGNIADYVNNIRQAWNISDINCDDSILFFISIADDIMQISVGNNILDKFSEDDAAECLSFIEHDVKNENYNIAVMDGISCIQTYLSQEMRYERVYKVLWAIFLGSAAVTVLSIVCLACSLVCTKRKDKYPHEIKIHWPIPPPELKIYDQEDCVICYEKLSEKSITLVCGHRFCEKCIANWILVHTQQPNCPTCRNIVILNKFQNKYDKILYV